MSAGKCKICKKWFSFGGVGVGSGGHNHGRQYCSPECRYEAKKGRKLKKNFVAKFGLEKWKLRMAQKAEKDRLRMADPARREKRNATARAWWRRKRGKSFKNKCEVCDKIFITNIAHKKTCGPRCHHERTIANQRVARRLNPELMVKSNIRRQLAVASYNALLKTGIIQKGETL